MSDTRIGALNHSAKAAFHLKEMLGKNFQQMSSSDVQYLEWICTQLDNSQKFNLPKGGKFLEDTKASEFLELMRLPYHVTAVEFCIDTDKAVKRDTDQVESIQRIALCFSPSSPALINLETKMPLIYKDDSEGFYVIPVFCLNSKYWVPMPFIFFVGQGSKGNIMPSEGFYTQPFEINYTAGMQSYRMTEMQHGIKAMMELVKNDSRDEIDVAMNFALAMNCSNVGTELVKASTIMNSKRKKKGKVVVSDFHILSLNLSTVKTASVPTGKGGAKKRQHVRRGHIRRLENKAIWVNSTVVGTGEKVSKIYNIE